MLIEIHAIQSFGPSNLNRDDTGNPKETVFGGVRRARISSQAQKRPIRTSTQFKDAIQVDIGTRTKRLVHVVSDELKRTGLAEADAIKRAAEFVNKLSVLDAKKKDQNLQSTLAFLSRDEIRAIAADLAQAGDKADVDSLSKAFVRKFSDRTSAPDIALFGRMLADHAELNIDAACQVAHAISTHRADLEFDYFTALDDLQPEDTSGADMIGLTPFNSATFYRYARIDWPQLVKNLDGDTDLALRAVHGFLTAFAYVLPTGKQNTFAAHSQPDFLLAIVRPNGQGWALTNAFEKPVRAQDGGYVDPSIRAMVEYWIQIENAYQTESPLITAILNPKQTPLDGLQAYTVSRLPDLVNAVTGALQQGG